MWCRGSVDQLRVEADRNGEGGVAEWPKVRHWKCRVGATLPWVRIPPPPPINPQHGEAMLTVGETVRAFVLAQSVVALRGDGGSVREMGSPGGEMGSAARRRPKTGREAYSLYVERPDEGANEADGPLSAAGTGWPC